MTKKYTIREGFSFVVGNGVVKGGGEIVELEDDVATNHAHKLELVAEKAPAKAKKQAGEPVQTDFGAGPAPEGEGSGSTAEPVGDAPA